MIIPSFMSNAERMLGEETLAKVSNFTCSIDQILNLNHALVPLVSLKLWHKFIVSLSRF